MNDQPQNPPGLMGFFQSMPNWSKSIVFALTVVPVSIAISGMILNVNVGSYLDKYMEIQIERQRQATEAAADRIISSFVDRLDDLEQRLVATAGSAEELNARVDRLALTVEENRALALKNKGGITEIHSWACGPVTRDGNPKNDPDWCD